MPLVAGQVSAVDQLPYNTTSTVFGKQALVITVTSSGLQYPRAAPRPPRLLVGVIVGAGADMTGQTDWREMACRYVHSRYSTVLLWETPSIIHSGPGPSPGVPIIEILMLEVKALFVLMNI